MVLRATRQQTEVLAAGDGLARISRQQIEVLSAGLGATRVTRQYVEVLTECFVEVVTDVLELIDSVTVGKILGRPVSDSLGLVESVEVHGPIYITIQHTLGLAESVNGHRAVTHITVQDVLDFQERVGRTIPVTVNQVLSFTQEGVRRKTGIVNDALTLVQTISVGKGGSVRESLDLVQTVSAGGVYARTITEDLGFRQACTCWIAGRRFDRQYAPFVGDGAGEAPDPPAATLVSPHPEVGVRFQLVYPAVGATTDSCTLRAPNLGNKDRLQFTRINRETRGGTLVVYADPIWPKSQVLVLSFSGLARDEGLALLTFLAAHLGQEIGLIDWESRYWQGIVTTTTDPVVEDSAGRFTANFEFEGELDPDWEP